MKKKPKSRRATKISAALTTRSVSPLRVKKADVEKLFKRALDLAADKHRERIEGEKSLAVDVIFVDDDEIAHLNSAHLKHRGPTDVLSFPMGEYDPERDAYNLGEVVVSVETAMRESEARGISFENELCRYCVHGFLHLLGYDDSTSSLRQEMFEVQENAMANGE